MLQYQRKQNYEFGNEAVNNWLVNLVCGGRAEESGASSCGEKGGGETGLCGRKD
jgi:hypothetical protein